MIGILVGAVAGAAAFVLPYFAHAQMATGTAETIFNGLTAGAEDYVVLLVPAVILFGLAIWGIRFVLRKGWGYLNGL